MLFYYGQWSTFEEKDPVRVSVRQLDKVTTFTMDLFFLREQT